MVLPATGAEGRCLTFKYLIEAGSSGSVTIGCEDPSGADCTGFQSQYRHTFKVFFYNNTEIMIVLENLQLI